MSLDQQTAIQRSRIIRKDSISYKYTLILRDTYLLGIAQINFYLETINFQSLPIDFSGQQITTLTVNTVNQKVVRKDSFVYLNKSLLQKGRNKLLINYRCNYSKNQSGCILYEEGQDPYIFTDFQPYYCNMVFPCFDQPNLKAKIQLAIVAKNDPQFVVVANQPIVSQQNVTKQCQFLSHTNYLMQENTKITFFQKTELIPTYIVCFAFGKYKSIKNPSSNVSMTLYSIRSSFPLLEKASSFIFEVTEKSMQFFEQFFGKNYVFSKFDQIFIKQCGFTAMQNAGLVTYDAATLLHQFPTQYNYYDLAQTIVHQLSHHWFGNYVTMDWWDDLWLNQSFADFIAQFGLSKIRNKLTTHTTLQTPQMQFRDRKGWGYQQDSRNSATHAIRGKVADTSVALSIFDGITYAKGGATMKQLMFLVGQANFSQGLANYFNEFGWKNATIDNLIDKMKGYFDPSINIEDWKKSWLYTPSHNVFDTFWNASDKSNNAKLKIIQRNLTEQYPSIRTHNIKIAFIKPDYSIVQQSVLINKEETQVTYDGSNNYQAIFVNYQDHSFLFNTIDAKSLSFFMGKNNVTSKYNISQIGNQFDRICIWYNIADMVRRSYIRVTDYAQFVINAIFEQKNDFIFEKIVDDLLQDLTLYCDESLCRDYRSEMFERIQQQLINIIDNPANKDRIIILKSTYIDYAGQIQQIQQLVAWLKEQYPKLQNKKIQVNQLYWKIILKMYTIPDDILTIQQKQNIFDMIKQKDNSYRAEDARVTCGVIVANTIQQLNVIYQGFKDPSISFAKKQLMAKGWRTSYHKDIVNSQFKQIYYYDIINLGGTLDYQTYQLIYTRLSPMDNDYQYQKQKYLQVIAQLSLDNTLQAHTKNIKKIVDDLTLRITNLNFNSDLNQTLTQFRAIDRYTYFKQAQTAYIAHVIFYQDNYQGLTQISFQLTSLPNYLPIDFIGSVKRIVVNGLDTTIGQFGITHQNQFILVPRVHLKKGINSVFIAYQNQYDNDGLGCCYYKDTLPDTTVNYYVYTNFQPWGAHRFMPCFDQPDLKAPVAFDVIIPDNWISAANQPASTQKQLKDFNTVDYLKDIVTNNKSLVSQWINVKSGSYLYSVFDATPDLPTYLYCVIAGQYYRQDATAQQLHETIPMSVYSLKSYEDIMKVNADFVFAVTKASLDLYSSKFKTPYKFRKYDTVFCHQFKAGAMQNPGLVTFNDTYLYPGDVAVEKKVAFAGTIAHEAAHLWFGDYVTMKWWDDLWLNQSFADFISFWCLQKIKIDPKITKFISYPSGWIPMMNRVVGGYREDQIDATNHPVRSKVINTSLATAYFDGITYRKGSSCLKQLMFIMGQDNFLDGLKDYFDKYAWSNTVIDDFLGCMNTYFPKGNVQLLKQWRNMWLQTSSLNILTTDWKPNTNNDPQSFTINQTNFSPYYSLLRFSSLNIAFYKADGTCDIKKVNIQAKQQTTINYDPTDFYQGILINADHQAFVKHYIDPTSKAFFRAKINKIVDPFHRMIAWHYMNEQVRDCQQKCIVHKDNILNNLYNQKQDSLFDFIFRFLIDSVSSYLPGNTSLQIKKQIFIFNYDKLIDKGVDKSQNRKTIIKDLLPSICVTNDQILKLQQWRKGTNIDLNQYPISFSQSWAVVVLVNGSTYFTVNEKQNIYNNQKAKYPGITADLIKLTCDALNANPQQFQTIYQLFKEQTVSISNKTYYGNGWNHPIHYQLIQQAYKNKFFTDLPAMNVTLRYNHFESYYVNLRPNDNNVTDLDLTIDGFSKINLPGSAAIGHMIKIKQYLDQYRLKRRLFIYNSS